MASKFARSSASAKKEEKPSRPPTSNRYSYVKPVVQSGPNLLKYKPPPDRTGENFKRVKRTTLANLLRAQEARDSESVYDLDPSDAVSVVTHDGESEVNVSLERTDVMILDTRDPERYELVHIDGAVNFPPILLRRDQMPPGVFAFRNKPDKLLVLYTETDEQKEAKEVGNAFVQKDYRNIAMLTGGLLQFALKYPERIRGNPEVIPGYREALAELRGEKPKPPAPKKKAEKVYVPGSAAHKEYLRRNGMLPEDEEKPVTPKIGSAHEAPLAAAAASGMLHTVRPVSITGAAPSPVLRGAGATLAGGLSSPGSSRLGTASATGRSGPASSRLGDTSARGSARGAGSASGRTGTFVMPNSIA